MSTPAESSVAAGKDVDRRMSLGKYMKRMSSVFKKDKLGKSGSPGGSPSGPSTPKIEEEGAKKELTEQEAAPAA